jgi:hypothetical protein
MLMMMMLMASECEPSHHAFALRCFAFHINPQRSSGRVEKLFARDSTESVDLLTLYSRVWRLGFFHLSLIFQIMPHYTSAA